MNYLENPGENIRKPIENIPESVVSKPQDVADVRFELSDPVEDHEQGLARIDSDYVDMIAKFKDGSVTDAQSDAIERSIKKAASEGEILAYESAIALAVNLSSFINDLIASFAHQEEMMKSRQANDMTTSLEGALQNLQNSRRESGSITQAEFNEAFGILIEIEARAAVFDQQEIDLISFSSNAESESERSHMDVIRAQAKVDLRKFAKADPSLVPTGKNFDSLLDSVCGILESQFSSSSETAHRNHLILEKMKRMSTALTGLIESVLSNPEMRLKETGGTN